MPFAVLKSVREVSSEDKLHCAANLLQNEPAKKWKTGDEGEKSAYVIIEMKTAYSIKGIDIGNESSAFVEVQVGAIGCARENFKEILITCSFMTPIESRNGTNPNRVRCFNREALVKEVADEKWTLLKIICTQPFNKHVRYGLSFIKIHVHEASDTKKNIESSNSSLVTSKRICGNFTLRENSPDSESESTTALFNRWKGSRNKDTHGNTNLIQSSSIPRIPSPTSLKKPDKSKVLIATTQSVEKAVPKENVVLPDRNRNSLLFTDDDENESTMQDKHKKKLQKLEKVISADQERVTKEADKASKTTKHYEPAKINSKTIDKHVSKKVSSKKSPTTSSKPSAPSSAGHRRHSTSPCTSENPKKPKLDKPPQYKPFNQLLRGVVLVISGIQNPDRTDLRNKALALGAKYKADWDNTSTHLICAFKNTPKYNQVKKVGKIITRSWIEDCHSRKKRLPWRRYALDSAELTKPESEDEIFDESLKPQDIKPCSTPAYSDEDDDVREIYDNNSTSHVQHISSSSDTEDEIQRVLASTSPKKKPSTQTKDIFEVTTEEEDYISKSSTKTLQFFKNFNFFVSDQLSAVEKVKVERHIENFHGALTKSLEKANYVIANKLISDNGEFKGETVTPLWILECNDMECFIPTKRYLVT